MCLLTRRLPGFPLSMLLLVALLAGCNPVTTTTAPTVPRPAPPPPMPGNASGGPLYGATVVSDFPQANGTEIVSTRAVATRDTTPRPRSSSGGSGIPAGDTGKRIGPPSVYPDPSLTPGDLLPGVTGQQTCVSGYAKSVRSVTTDEKAAVYGRYGIPNVSGMHEVDHFIPLTLGGSNALTNLWPEPYTPPDAPTLGAHEKDQVENYLHGQVCSGRMTLAQAQDAIRTDWVAVYERIPKANTSGTNGGSSTRVPRRHPSEPGAPSSQGSGSRALPGG